MATLFKIVDEAGWEIDRSLITPDRDIPVDLLSVRVSNNGEDVTFTVMYKHGSRG